MEELYVNFSYFGGKVTVAVLRYYKGRVKQRTYHPSVHRMQSVMRLIENGAAIPDFNDTSVTFTRIWWLT